MTDVLEGQVALSHLLFTQSWEDPASDRRALRIQPADMLVTITSGGCNTLGFLLQNPAHVYAIDINPSQSYLLELKMAALRKLDYPDFLCFLGVREATNRRALYQALRGELSAEADAYWSARERTIRKGVLGQGRYERFVALFRALLRLVQGQKRIEGLFEDQTLEDQKGYFDQVWDTWRFRAIFSFFFNKSMLARRGLSADYFQFDDGSASFAESFYRRTKHVLRDLPVQSNYFVAQYLLGRYRSEIEMPEYLLPEHFETLRHRLGRITIITADAKKWLAEQEEASFDCFSLSNICELMSLEDTATTFREVARTARNGGRVCFRNLMIPRTVPAFLSQILQREEVLSEELLRQDRSFVYARVDAFSVVK